MAHNFLFVTSNPLPFSQSMRRTKFFVDDKAANGFLGVQNRPVIASNYNCISAFIINELQNYPWRFWFQNSYLLQILKQYILDNQLVGDY